MSENGPGVDDYRTFVLVVDDLGWTKHWLGSLRCDRLAVSIAKRPSVTPKVRIQAIESKSLSDTTTVEPSPTTAPYNKAIEQVSATLDAILRVIEPESVDPLVEDLRFSAFIEHLAAVALSDMHPIRTGDAGALHIAKTISELSRRALPREEVALDGLVVCTQYRAAVPFARQNHRANGEAREWDVVLARAGSTEIDGILGPDLAGLAEATAGGEPAERAAEEAREEIEPVEPSEPKVSAPLAEGAAQAVGEEEQSVAEALFFSCRHRGFQVEAPDLASVVLGPALISIPMALGAGASIRPIDSAVDDLAREVGVASVSVENDPERAYHVRFLVARRNRVFPTIPESEAPLLDAETQAYLGLYLGRTLDGRDFASYASAWPHMLVAGTTGSGKTTFIRSLLRQMARRSPTLVRIVLVDGKGDIDYLNVLPPAFHMPRFPDVVLGHQNALGVLDWIVEQEMPARRARVMGLARAQGGTRPRSAREMYVEAAVEGRAEPFPPLFVVIDEFAEIMRAGGKNADRFEQRVQQVAQVGRSGLVHLILATQRPDATVVRGAIKANLDSRVALRLPTHFDSMTVLGGKGAERLLGRGDLIFQSAGEPAVRLQGYDA